MWIFLGRDREALFLQRVCGPPTSEGWFVNICIYVNRFHYLWQFWLGQAWLTHLWWLTHGDVALSQWALRKRLGDHILTGLAVWKVRLASPWNPKTVVLLTATTAGLSFWIPTTCQEEPDLRVINVCSGRVEGCITSWGVLCLGCGKLGDYFAGIMNANTIWQVENVG